MELSLCSLCHVESSKTSFPDYGKDVSGRQESDHSHKTAGEENDENRKDDHDSNASDNEADILNNGLQTKDDEVEHVHEKLPVHQDVYDQNEI